MENIIMIGCCIVVLTLLIVALDWRKVNNVSDESENQDIEPDVEYIFPWGCVEWCYGSILVWHGCRLMKLLL